MIVGKIVGVTLSLMGGVIVIIFVFITPHPLGLLGFFLCWMGGGIYEISDRKK
jgi:hypothetical protein